MFGNEIVLWGPLVVPRKVQKRVSDTDLVNIGQLDHYVVFGTKFGPVQDFQRGKKCPLGVKQTLLDPLYAPLRPPNPPNPPSNLLKNPPNPLSDPPLYL